MPAERALMAHPAIRPDRVHVAGVPAAARAAADNGRIGGRSLGG
jgi:hypothetical protein